MFTARSTRLCCTTPPARVAPDSRRTYPMTAFVTGVPSRVNRFRIAARTCSSAICDSSLREVSRSPPKLDAAHFRLDQRAPVIADSFHIDSPSRPTACTASVLAQLAPDLTFHGTALLHGGITATAPRAATASWHPRVS